MRIGVDVRCLMDGKRTGVEEYTLGVLRAMVRDARDDEFVLFANSRSPKHLPSFPEPNVHVRSFDFPNTLFNASLKVLRSPRLDALVGGVDVFFLPSFRLVPLSQGCPLVLTVHDLSFVRHGRFFSRDRRTWHRLMSPRALARRAATVIAVSEATARDVVELYAVPRERVTVIRSGIAVSDVPLTAAHRAAVRARYRLPETFLLFLGTLEPRKNLDGLLAAYAAVRARGFPHALVLAGARGWMPAAFFSRLRAHPYAADIHLTGFIADADKPAVYRLASLFVYPSFYEGFGFPPLEALAAGTPVVTSFNSAIPEIVGDVGASLANPYDPAELAAVIADRLEHPVAVPHGVLSRIRERYAWRRAAQETLAVFRAAAALRT